MCERYMRVAAYLLVLLVGRELDRGAREDADAVRGVALEEALHIGSEHSYREHTHLPAFVTVDHRKRADHAGVLRWLAGDVGLRLHAV